MTVHSGMLRMQTGGDSEIVDITEGVRSVLATSGVQVGLASVFAVGSTVAVTTMEYEPGGVSDLRELLARLAPEQPPDGGTWEHNVRNHDTNAHAHLRASIVGPSESVPVVAGELALGTWQQIVLIDFDVRSRSRTALVHILS